MFMKIMFALFCLLLGMPGSYGQSSPVVTEHGFLFVNHTGGKGQRAARGEAVWVHVDTYIGDTLMGSTNNKGGEAREYVIPDSIQSGIRIPFLYDAALLMGEGDSATVYQAIDSTIRRFVPASQKNAQDLRYEVKIVKVTTKAEKALEEVKNKARLAEVEQQVDTIRKDYFNSKLDRQIETYPSGLQVLIKEIGTGAAVKSGEPVKVNYYGCLMNGKMFDSSFERGQTFDFPAGVGQMIPGFDEGVIHLHHGGKAYFFIPAKLGYGQTSAPDGKIPPNSRLLFYVELL